MVAELLRWGLLGTARINDRLIPHLFASRRSTVAAVASRDAVRAREYADCRDIPTAHGSYEALIRDDSIDIVYISLPNPQHAGWALEAVRAGKHVLVEKPIALRTADVAELARAAVQHDRLVQEASMMMFSPQPRKVSEIIQSGRIGRPVAATGLFTFKLGKTRDIRLEPDGGGSLWDVGIYPVTLFNSLFGSAPLDVGGMAARDGHSVDMVFAALLRYPSGVLAQLLSSMKSAPTWQAVVLGEEGSIFLDHPWCNLVGEPAEITVVVSRDGQNPVTFGDERSGEPPDIYRFDVVDAYRDEVDGVERIILDGVDSPYPITQSEANVRTIRSLIDATTQSTPRAPLA